jgi:hypothetical protein
MRSCHLTHWSLRIRHIWLPFMLDISFGKPSFMYHQQIYFINLFINEIKHLEQHIHFSSLFCQLTSLSWLHFCSVKPQRHTSHSCLSLQDFMRIALSMFPKHSGADSWLIRPVIGSKDHACLFWLNTMTDLQRMIAMVTGEQCIHVFLFQ